MTNEEIRGFIENAIKENKVMLFMKGTPQQPACGFSMRTSGVLNTLGVKYAALDILPDPRIREELSGLSGWPTIPQLFVDGELIGGCDIVMEMFESGDLAETLGVEQPDLAEAPDEPEHELPQRRSQRTEIEELTGQTWVPVLVDGEEVISDSHRIVEYLGSSSRAGSPAR